MGKKVTWFTVDNTPCLDFRSIPNMNVVGDLYTGILNISLPQAFLEYQDPSWDPPSRWDDSIAVFFLDYNVNNRIVKNERNGNDRGTETGVNATGVMGVNLGAWRFRTDWQASGGNLNSNEKSWRWNQLYVFRAIRSLGASLESDNAMIPPRLQGYAPEIASMARTNATVIVRQDGRIVYQNDVCPSPFRIQDVNTFGGGTLDVSIEEQDRSVQSFKVETSRLGTLTRPGQFLYKVVVGKPTKNEHDTQGPVFSLGGFK